MHDLCTTTKIADWHNLIGKAILSFGDIELISLYCLERILVPEHATHAAKLTFSSRTEILINALKNKQDLSNPLKSVLTGFEQAKVLAKTRNIIAHNPALLDIYFTHDTQNNPHTEHTIKAARGRKETLNLDQIKEFSAEVESLAAFLWLNFSQAFGTSNLMYRLHVEEGIGK